MGLSAYGKPKYFEKLKNIINIKKNTFELNLNYFSHHYNFSNYVSTDGNIMFPKIFNQKIHEIIGPERLKDQKLNEQHADLAASVQKFMNIFYLIHLIHGKKFLKRKFMFCRWLCNEFKSKWFNIGKYKLQKYLYTT